MANTKTWPGVSQTNKSTTNGDGSDSDNWRLHSIVNSVYRWLASGSGTSEFYLDLAGGGDPGIVEPTNVQEVINTVVTNMTAGTAGSLSAGEWDFADNDTLGYSTIYVRTDGSVDPDTLDKDTITYSDVPKAGDSIVIPADATQPWTSGLDYSGVTLADFIKQKGSPYVGVIRSDEHSPLHLTLNSRFSFDGTGNNTPSSIDLNAIAIDAVVEGTARARDGKAGVYINGSAIDELLVNGGRVAAGVLHEDSPTIAKVRTAGEGSVWLGEGCTISTSVDLRGGSDHLISCNVPTLSCDTDTNYEIDREAKITTALNHNAGTGVLNGAPTSGSAITTINHNGGTLDGSQSSKERTWDTYTPSLNAEQLELLVDENVTITTKNDPSSVGYVQLLSRV